MDIHLGSARRDFTALRLDGSRREALGQFLRHLAAGERVARSSAILQARLAPDGRAARFFRAQARHEGFHARLFDLFAAWLGAPALALLPSPYAQYQERVAEAAGAQRFLETVLATQVILEALGETLLVRLTTGLERSGAGFHRLRRVIRRQEEAHHAFGMDTLREAITRGAADHASLRAAAAPYISLCDDMIASGAPALAHFHLTRTDIGNDFRSLLPDWLGRAA